MSDPFGQPCPCGNGAAYEACCGPLHHGERQAVTAEELMRSRYAAYATGEADYLFRTWHPRTRPADVTIDAAITWRALEVTDTVAGCLEDDHGEVEFTARYEDGGGQGSMRERSRFERRAGRWFYLTGVVH
ncbi:MAG: motif domain protein [Mycobacterium sp.]|jgi:SEC-C motif-containing protein|nr:motif domain protein [Mycobacterium sp.]